MYTSKNYGRVLLLLAMVPLLLIVGGSVGYYAHVPAPPTNVVPQEVSLALDACLTSLERTAAAEVQWGPWAEIATR